MKTYVVSLCWLIVNCCVLLASDLSRYESKNRVLLAMAPTQNDPRLIKQQTMSSQSSSGFAERDIAWVTETDAKGPLHRQFGVGAEDFRVVLIGKDGHTALESSQPISSEELFRVIDSMPMRKNEIRRQKAG